jgi:nitroreductase
MAIGVVSSARELIKIPVWEQELSAGAVCQNILIAAHALGFVGNWLTEWYSYHPVVKQKIGLKPGERMAGFIYIGTPKEEVVERPRPDMDMIITHF